MFGHFVKLALKGLKTIKIILAQIINVYLYPHDVKEVEAKVLSAGERNIKR